MEAKEVEGDLERLQCRPTMSRAIFLRPYIARSAADGSAMLMGTATQRRPVRAKIAVGTGVSIGLVGPMPSKRYRALVSRTSERSPRMR